MATVAAERGLAERGALDIVVAITGVCAMAKESQDVRGVVVFPVGDWKRIAGQFLAADAGGGLKI